MSTEIFNQRLSENDVRLTDEQQQQLVAIRQWIQTEADFHGRSDDAFILKFLLGCKFDVEKIKKKMTMYYKNRRNISQWWANRDIMDDNLQQVLPQKMSTLLIDRKKHQPLVAFTLACRIHPNSEEFDNIVKLHSIMMDIAMQRYSCQMNGAHWIVDCTNYPKWAIKTLLTPINAANIINSFLLSMPVKVNSISFLNTPLVAQAIWMLAQPFLTQKIKKRIYFYRSDWSPLYDHVPRELIPDEYGGYAGPMRPHEDAFLREIMDFNDYLKEDNKYGQQRNHK